VGASNADRFKDSFLTVGNTLTLDAATGINLEITNLDTDANGINVMIKRTEAKMVTAVKAKKEKIAKDVMTQVTETKTQVE